MPPARKPSLNQFPWGSAIGSKPWKIEIWTKIEGKFSYFYNFSINEELSREIYFNIYPNLLWRSNFLLEWELFLNSNCFLFIFEIIKSNFKKYNQYRVLKGTPIFFAATVRSFHSFYFISFSCPKDFSLRIFICLLEKDSANNYKHAEQAYIIRRTRELNNVSFFPFFFFFFFLPLLSFYFRRELKMQHASNASCFNYGRRISN